MSGSISRLMLTAAVSLLSVAFAAGAARADLMPGASSTGDFIISFDESGNFVCNVGGCSATTGTDPTHLVAGNVLIYGLPAPVVAGTTGILDPGGALSDALRFTNANGGLTGTADRMIFYSFDNLGFLADIGGVPPGLVLNNIGATENAVGMFIYNPGGGANVYVGLSPVPGPIVGAGLPGLILASGGLLVLGWWRRRRQLVA